eukprot:COSAG06_NODE_53114_length_302_cov_0.448276_1_plen_51_part_01
MEQQNRLPDDTPEPTEEPSVNVDVASTAQQGVELVSGDNLTDSLNLFTNQF